MRRGGVECLPPDINASRADFTVEDGKVRYALGALKGVGEKAMEALVAEREAQRAVRQPRGFRRADRPAAAQPPPAREPRRRRRVRLRSTRTAPRCSPPPRRSSPMPPAPPTSATSGQHGLFGGAADGGVAPIRLPRDATWTLAAAHGRRARGLRLLFLRPSGRRAAPSARRAQGQDLRRAGRDADAGRRRARVGDDGRPGRGRALADLGQGPPLHDGDAYPTHRASSRPPCSTTSRAPRSRRRPRPAAAGC